MVRLPLMPPQGSMDDKLDDNGCRKRLPSFRQIHRSTIEEIEGMITGGQRQTNTTSNNTRLQEEDHKYHKPSMFSIGSPINSGGSRRQTPTPPLEQSDYFFDDDSPNNYNFIDLSPHRRSPQYNFSDTIGEPPLNNGVGVGGGGDYTTINQLRTVPQNPFGRVDIRTLL